MTVAIQVAKTFLTRAQHCPLSDPDNAAIDFTLGAIAALSAMDPAGENAQIQRDIGTLSFTAVMLSARGVNYLVEVVG